MKKVLIITAGVDIGGLEIFAVNISRFAPLEEFTFDYLVFEGNTQDLAPRITERGNRIFTVRSPHYGYSEYIKCLGKLIDENKYDVIHSHTQFNSGLNMLVAKRHHVPIRITHSHTTAHESKISGKQRIYESIMRLLIRLCSTNLCACGVAAGKWAFGKKAFVVINNGIETCRFRYNKTNRAIIREKYAIPDSVKLIGHCGAIAEVKNQEHIIRNLPANAFLMCVGKAPNGYGDYLCKLAKELGREKNVLMIGSVSNVEEYLSAFDVFAFPSLREGTPLALLEAQANGLPCLISENVPADALVTDLVSVIPLKDNQGWKEALNTLQRNDPEKYEDILYKKGYDVHSALEPLYDIYRGN